MRDGNDGIILANPDVLHEAHVPPEIHARDAQIQDILHCLSPLVDHQKPMNCWLHGSPGAGKTSAARWMLRKLHQDTGIRGIYVNCWEYPTFFSVLECIARELRMLGSDKLSTSFKLERLKARLSEERAVLVLDEIDQPPPSERNAILYNLSDLPKVGLICACNSQHVYFGLEERVKSRLNPARIPFQEYSSDELLQILERRAQFALAPGTYSEYLLRSVADLADGDARLAIQTLKNAAYLGERDDHGEIRSCHVNRTWNAAQHINHSFLLRRLTDHHRLLYELIAKEGRILSGDLWRLYERTCRERRITPIAVRTYSDYCNKLAHLGLIDAKRAPIQGKVREFSVVD